MINYDVLNNADPREVSETAFRVLDSVQTKKPEVQVLGAAAFFILLCEELKVDPAEAWRAITNLLATKEGFIDHFEAIRAYLREEL